MDDGPEIGFCIFFWVLVCGGIGYVIGQGKERGWSGFWYVLFLGPIGWILAALILDYPFRCDNCKSGIPKGATVCKSCGAEFGRVVGSTAPIPNQRKSGAPPTLGELLAQPSGAKSWSELIEIAQRRQPQASPEIVIRIPEFQERTPCPYCQVIIEHPPFNPAKHARQIACPQCGGVFDLMPHMG